MSWGKLVLTSRLNGSGHEHEKEVKWIDTDDNRSQTTNTVGKTTEGVGNTAGGVTNTAGGLAGGATGQKPVQQ